MGSSSIARTTSSPQWRARARRDRVAQHLLLGREVEIHQGLQSSPWRCHGLSSGEVGIATFTSDSVQVTSPTRTVRSSSTQAHPVVVDGLHVAHGALDHHRVAGEDRLAHLEAQPPEAPLRSRPVGDEALEPRRPGWASSGRCPARPGGRRRSGGRGASAASRAPRAHRARPSSRSRRSDSGGSASPTVTCVER